MKLVVLPRFWKAKLAHEQDTPKAGQRNRTDSTWQRFFGAAVSTFAPVAPAVIWFPNDKSPAFQQDSDLLGPTSLLFNLQSFSPKHWGTVK